MSSVDSEQGATESQLDWDAHGETHAGNLRPHNEDAFLCSKARGLWAVADGMGGHHAGDVASRAVVDALAEVARSDRLAELVADCRSQLQAVNQTLQANPALEKGQLSGSTVVALLVRGRRGVALWAGDSRLYRLSQTATPQLQQITQDHSKVAELVRMGLLTEEQAERHPEASAITRAVGVQPQLEIEALEFEVADDDVFLLCSDGLTRHLSADQIAQLMVGRGAFAATQALLAAVLETPARDNVTVVVAHALDASDSQTVTRLNPVYRSEQAGGDEPTVLDEDGR
ncbi:MAG: PP2C family serine/threonine-protein phosphatase [Pseudomonadales bacterium]